MRKTKENQAPKQEDVKVEVAPVEVAEAKRPVEEEQKEKEEDVSPVVDKCMQLYKELPEMYISESGFVYVTGTPSAMRGNAKLYKNKYYNK